MEKKFQFMLFPHDDEAKNKNVLMKKNYLMREILISSHIF